MLVKAVCILVVLQAVEPLLIHQLSAKRAGFILQAKKLECVSIVSRPGKYQFDTLTGDDVTCTAFILAPPDKLVHVAFDSFQLHCDSGSLLTMTDGWEVEGQEFPSLMDVQKRDEERHYALCSPSDLPMTSYEFSQNAAMVNWRIAGRLPQGFKLTIRFIDNPYPCNVIAMRPLGTVTLRNYGRRVNCSFSVINKPAVIDLLALDIGLQAAGDGLANDEVTSDIGFSTRCKENALGDYAEILDGNGLDPAYMWRTVDLCGQYSTSPGQANRLNFALGCATTVIRLVSSGLYDNSLTFTYKPLSLAQLLHAQSRQC